MRRSVALKKQNQARHLVRGIWCEPHRGRRIARLVSVNSLIANTWNEPKKLKTLGLKPLERWKIPHLSLWVYSKSPIWTHLVLALVPSIATVCEMCGPLYGPSPLWFFDGNSVARRNDAIWKRCGCKRETDAPQMRRTADCDLTYFGRLLANPRYGFRYLAESRYCRKHPPKQQVFKFRSPKRPTNNPEKRLTSGPKRRPKYFFTLGKLEPPFFVMGCGASTKASWFVFWGRLDCGVARSITLHFFGSGFEPFLITFNGWKKQRRQTFFSEVVQ